MCVWGPEEPGTRGALGDRSPVGRPERGAGGDRWQGGSGGQRRPPPNGTFSKAGFGSGEDEVPGNVLLSPTKRCSSYDVKGSSQESPPALSHGEAFDRRLPWPWRGHLEKEGITLAICCSCIKSPLKLSSSKKLGSSLGGWFRPGVSPEVLAYCLGCSPLRT